MESIKINNFYQLFGSPKKTNWALLLLIAIIPLRNIQIQYLPNFGGGINTLNVLFIMSLLHALIYGDKNQQVSPINGVLVWYIITGIIALVFGYSFLGNGASGNWNHLKDQLIPVFMVFIIQRSVTDEIQWRRVLAATLVSVPYCARLVWNQYQNVASWHYSDDLRIRGPFMDLGANEMGAYGVTVCLLSISLLLCSWNNKKWRVIFSIVSALAFLCVLYSYSRGGYLALLLGLAIIFFKYEYSSKLIIPIVILILVAGATMPVSITERFSSISVEEGEERDESAESRFVFWAIAFDKWKERPLFGYGYRTVQDSRINPYEMDTHNYFVKVLVERGMLGVLTMFWLFLAIWKLINKNMKLNNNEPLRKSLALAMPGVFFALLLGNMFGDRFSHYPIITVFWVFVALISCYPYEPKDNGKDNVKKSVFD